MNHPDYPPAMKHIASILAAVGLAAGATAILPSNAATMAPSSISRATVSCSTCVAPHHVSAGGLVCARLPQWRLVCPAVERQHLGPVDDDQRRLTQLTMHKNGPPPEWGAVRRIRCYPRSDFVTGRGFSMSRVGRDAILGCGRDVPLARSGCIGR